MSNQLITANENFLTFPWDGKLNEMKEWQIKFEKPTAMLAFFSESL